MIVVLQCAARKAADVGHLRTRDGRKVMFVANPDLAHPDDECIYARPAMLPKPGHPGVRSSANTTRILATIDLASCLRGGCTVTQRHYCPKKVV